MNNLQMDIGIANEYKSSSQKARVITENWLSGFGYCPTCGSDLKSVKANSKVCDFKCIKCTHEFELKSKLAANIAGKISDGAYSSMIERINAFNNPHFFFLGYDNSFHVTNLVAVPNYFFQPSVIEKRNPLADTAKRAGWVGCNILLDQIPEIGKIKLIDKGQITSQEDVLRIWQKTVFLSRENKIDARGWTLDVMKCIEQIRSKEFSLDTLYGFEEQLFQKHPHNRFVKDKIRQQLQILRDKGYLEFVRPGRYKLIE